MKFDSMEYTIGSHFASALVNGDYSGLDDNEARDLDSWLEENQFRGGFWDIGETHEFTRCEISKLMGECITAIQHYPAH
jgi:hypothetical protein